MLFNLLLLALSPLFVVLCDIPVSDRSQLRFNDQFQSF
jgi:hypothetical protein